MLVTTAMTSPIGQPHDITVSAGGASGSVSDQLAALQAKSISLDLNRSGQSTQDLAPEISSSTRLGNNLGEVASAAGNAASDLLSSSNKALSQPTDPSTGLPKLQFLSDTTAIKTPAVVDDGKTANTSSDKTAFVAAAPSVTSVVEPKTVTGAVGQASFLSPTETVQDRMSSGIIQDSQINTIAVNTKSSSVNTAAAQPSMMLRSNAVVLSSYGDAPSYSYEASGVVVVNGVINSWANQLSLADNFNRAYPGVVVNTSYDDIGDRRDAAWVQPSMHAYATSDSGARADTVQTWFEGNADTIGYNVIGTPIPHDRYIALRDWLHGEIKQHHMGNQETISNVLHMLATQDNQTTTQLNNIWHTVLGVAITSSELSDAVTQISIGHATLSTERQSLAHSSRAAALYAQKYQDVHGHPPSEADIRFAQDKIGNGTSLQQYIWDEAHNGQTSQEFGNVFRQVHGREPSSADIQYAQQKIGNGASLQQYRWDEAHNGQTSQEFGNVFRQVHGREPSSADIQYAQQKIGNGASLQQYRWDEAHSDAVANQLREIVSTTQGRSYQDGDAAWVRARQDELGNGNQTPAQIRQSIARWTADNGGYDATFQAVHGRAPGAGDRNYAATQIGNGWSVADYRWNEAHSVSAAQDYRVMFRNVAGKDPGDGDVQWLQNAVANGSNYVTLRQNLAWSDWGHDAVRNVYAQTAGIQNPTQVQYDVYQRELANGASVADITRKLAYSWEGHDAVRNVYARTAGIQNPTQVQYDVYQRELANGASVADITRKLAYSWEGHDAVRNVYARTAGIQNPTQVQYDVYQRELANG
ncbi:hypothetical protein, partial [Asaia bogorensis]